MPQKNNVRDMWFAMKNIKGVKENLGPVDGSLERAYELHCFLKRIVNNLLPCFKLHKRYTLSRPMSSFSRLVHFHYALQSWILTQPYQKLNQHQDRLPLPVCLQ